MNAPTRPTRPQTSGPFELAVEIVMGLVFVTVFSCFIGVLIEVIGSYTIWPNQGTTHAQTMVANDLAHIAEAPRSLIVDDTIAFSEQLVAWVQWPYDRFGLLEWHQRTAQRQQPSESPTPQKAGFMGRMRGAGNLVSQTLGTWALMSMYVVQDVLLRMSVAAFALPAFVLACMVGVVDGLVRRDLRRWGGGRESSFVYHHAKRYTVWALTGGFSLYLAWPFGGFNPAYMVLVFTVLVAFTMSTTVAAFKKYV